ncbi:COG3772 Phage-related lysozyme (muraminidase) [uncultured Caudovirales phage]|uniref:Lysozyme n=1 Tax=uncultured Caudovirales phage TaxID=2100421 RepID=A0A6J5P6B8_9CAUD|nr:COG3772 Phage-related lysozyme (muraminidase) [uncultured Caudovirales phage]
MIPDLAIALIARFEGFSAKPYLCPAGKWTIGYGTLCRPDHPPVTEEEAQALLIGYLERVAPHILVQAPALENSEARLAAVLSWVYNLGLGNFTASTFRRCLAAQDWPGAAFQCRRWSRAGGKRLAGLVARREVEARLLCG